MDDVEFMLNLKTGQRLDLLEKQFDFEILLKHYDLIIDCSCFPVDINEKMIDDKYMVFYGQPESPCGTIKMLKNNQSQNETNICFSINLHDNNNRPKNIASYIFALSIDNNLSSNKDGNFNNLKEMKIKIGNDAIYDINENIVKFDAEKALILFKFYKHNEKWKLQPVIQGFNDGLDKLVIHFGGEISNDENTEHKQLKISLDKVVDEKLPLSLDKDIRNHIISLSKKADVVLKKNSINNIQAKVALVLDASGSMSKNYNSGSVQEVVNRLIPIAVNFDDNYSLDCWAFGDKPCELSSINLNNFSNFINNDNGGWKRWNVGSRINNETDVIKEVLSFYSKDNFNDNLPVYVLFISDGGVHDNRGITNAIVQASKKPIFWQFVGLGGYDYGILEKLDNMSGRFVDNCDFFAMDKINDFSEEKLYEKMFEEFPSWLKEIKNKNILK